MPKRDDQGSAGAILSQGDATGGSRVLESLDMTARRLFEAIPSPAFIVDEDMTVLAANTAAEKEIPAQARVRYRMKSGALLNCINDRQSQAGCGSSPQCGACAIRNGVGETFTGERVSRKKYKLEKDEDGKRSDVYLLISASAVDLGGRKLALLVLEDVTELDELRRVLPICARCKKIRDDNNYWHNVDTYLRDRENIAFTHSLCPSCVRELYPGLEVGPPQPRPVPAK